MKESIQTLLEEIAAILESSSKLDHAIEERLHPILEPANPNLGTVKDARGNPAAGVECRSQVVDKLKQIRAQALNTLTHKEQTLARIEL